MATQSPTQNSFQNYQQPMIDNDRNFPITSIPIKDASPIKDTAKPTSLSNSKVVITDSKNLSTSKLGSKKNSVAPLEKYVIPQPASSSEAEIQAKVNSDLEMGITNNISQVQLKSALENIQNGSHSQISDLKDKDASSELFIKEGKEIKTPTGREEEEQVKTGFEKFQAMEGFCIQQKFEVFQEGGWQSLHRSYVHTYEPTEDRVGKKAFQCNESSSWCAKQCLSNYCRPFKVIINTCNSKEAPDSHKPFLSIERSCTCTCLSFNRPEIIVRYIEEGKNEYLGRIQDCFNFGNIRLHIYNKEDALKYVIEGNCCQWGLLCNCYCQACQKVDFLVKPTEGNFAHLKKKSTQHATVAFPNAERFLCDLPTNTSAEDKALLLSAVLFLDSRYFEGDP